MLWPLPTDPQSELDPGSRFAALRPWGAANPTRYHVGVDLAASEGTPVLAPEDGTITATDRGWDGSAKALLLECASRTWLFGCVAQGQSPPVGTRVDAGDRIGAVGFYTKSNGEHSSMLHVTVFSGAVSPTEANKRQRWWRGDLPPPGLMDPWPLLQGAQPPEEPTPPGPPPAGLYVETSGGTYSSERPCLAVNGVLSCGPSQAAAWGVALYEYVDRAAAEYIRRGLDVLPGTAETERGREWLREASLALQADMLKPLGGGNSRVHGLVGACQAAEAARRAFGGVVAPPPVMPNPAKSSGGGVAAALAGLGVIGVLAAVVVARR